MNSKLQILPAPLNISSYLLKAGDSSQNLGPSQIAWPSDSYSPDISITINGNSYPLSVGSSSPRPPGLVYPPEYNFFYDILSEYETIYGQFFSIDSFPMKVAQSTYFWPGELLEWFNNCRDTVFGQNLGHGTWRLSFVNEQDRDDMRVVLNSGRREHGFMLQPPTDLSCNDFADKIREWANANLTNPWAITITPINQVFLEVKDAAEAVMAKIVWVDGNQEKDLP